MLQVCIRGAGADKEVLESRYIYTASLFHKPFVTLMYCAFQIMRFLTFLRFSADSINRRQENYRLQDYYVVFRSEKYNNVHF
jgi:hypothetical protein